MTLMRISPVEFPDQYRQICYEFLTKYISDMEHRNREHLGIYLNPGEVIVWNQIPIAELVATVAGIAAGRIPATYERIGEALECIQELAQMLIFAPGEVNNKPTPPGFYQTPIGGMIGRAQLTLAGDTLITQAEALKILDGWNHSKLNRWINEGKVTGYHNPDAANPRQGGTMVRKMDIEELKLMEEGDENVT